MQKYHGVLNTILKQLPEFSGVVLVQQHGQELLAHSRGLANRSDNLANTLTTRFGTASGTKTFTAIAISQLVAQGLLDFDQPLHSCVGIDLPTIDPAVTIHQLLCHSAGIPDYFDEATMHDYAALWATRPVYSMRSAHDFLPMIVANPTMFAPGERFHYNNAGFVLLGLVVEHLAGMPFQRYVEQHVFAAAGMHASGFFASDQLPEQTAIGYIDSDTPPGWRSNIFAIPIIGGGDGGAYVTAPDIGRFWQALLGNQLLPVAATQRMLSPHVTADAETAYGYGIWMARDSTGAWKYRMIGGDPGVCYTSTCYPAQDMQIIVLGNVSRGAWNIARALEELVEADWSAHMK